MMDMLVARMCERFYRYYILELIDYFYAEIRQHQFDRITGVTNNAFPFPIEQI